MKQRIGVITTINAKKRGGRGGGGETIANTTADTEGMGEKKDIMQLKRRENQRFRRTKPKQDNH